MYRSRRTYLALATAIVLSLGANSCTKSEVVSADDEAMNFSAYSAMSETKAGGSYVNGTSLSNILNPAYAQFGIYAFNQGSGAFDATSDTPSFMNNVEVSYSKSGSTETYSYSPSRYWPKDEANNKLAFYAYFPTIATGLGQYAGKHKHLVPHVASDGAGLGYFTYTTHFVKTDEDWGATGMADIMLSDLVTDQTYSGTNSGTPGLVSLTFHHQLTKVRFQAVLDKDYGATTTIAIQSLTLANVATSGKLTPTGDASQNAWSEVGTLETFALPSMKNLALSTTAAPAYGNGENVYLMIPQVTDDITATIVYTVTTATASVTSTAVIRLGDLTSGGSQINWGNSKNILYTITVGVNPIQFSASLSNDWIAHGHDITIE